jgi:hypothetical protein
MARTIYEKPTRALLKDMVNDLGLQPGQVFTTSRAIEWFRQHYPKLQPSSIRAHLVQAATNDPSRLHHPSTNESDDLLLKVAPGQFRLFDRRTDPAPIHELVQGDVAREEVLAEVLEGNEGADTQPGSSEFLLEKDLQRYLAENLECIEPGLRLHEEDGIRGIEFEAGGGRRIDILAVDGSGAFVVLELKVSKGYDRVVGQLLRYVNCQGHDHLSDDVGRLTSGLFKHPGCRALRVPAFRSGEKSADGRPARHILTNLQKQVWSVG